MRPARNAPGEPPARFAAMPQPERMLHQSSRPLDPVEASKPPCQIGCTRNVGAVMAIVKMGVTASALGIAVYR
jgi:hypothetical protein